MSIVTFRRFVMPSLPPASPFDAILHEHTHFGPSLAAATAAADRLALDPTNRHARQQARSAMRFIRTHALPHMKYEEAILFPRALDQGAPSEVIELLVRDHESLRRLAQRLEALDAGATPGGDRETEAPPSSHDPQRPNVPASQAELLRRFVQLFEWHLGREEELMTTLAPEGSGPLPEPEGAP
jgi:iron-sulfur cluster repair protein YtfE (RIC family)